jgi:hypothetical protein
MRLARHAKFETTHKFYLAVADDIVDRARKASDEAEGKVLVCTWNATDEELKKRSQHA